MGGSFWNGFESGAIGGAIGATLAYGARTLLGARNSQGSDSNVAEAKTDDGRPLAESEIEFAKKIYGDSIDYSKVRVYGSDWVKDNTIMTPSGDLHAGSNIYRADYSFDPDVNVRALFIHELAHMLQHQEGVKVWWEGLKITARGGYFQRNIGATYRVSWSANYLDVNIEQQAMLWEMAYRNRAATYGQ